MLAIWIEKVKNDAQSSKDDSNFSASFLVFALPESRQNAASPAPSMLEKMYPTDIYREIRRCLWKMEGVFDLLLRLRYLDYHFPIVLSTLEVCIAGQARSRRWLCS